MARHSTTLSTFAIILLFLTIENNALHLPMGIYSSNSVNFESNICTTNISIPTASEKCLSLCIPVHSAQLRCSDHALCMCHHAPSPVVQSCIDCIFDGMGDFARFVPESISKIADDLTRYARVCDSQAQMNTLDTNHPMREDPSPEILRYCSATYLTTEFSASDFSIWHSRRLHTIFPILSLFIALVFILIAKFR